MELLFANRPFAMRPSYVSLLLFVFLLPIMAGCDSSSSAELVAPKVRLTLELDGLTPLQEGFKYQAWVRDGFSDIPGEPFNVRENGSLVDVAGQSISSAFIFPVDITNASVVFITVEDKGDSDDVPSGTVVMAGDVSSFQATLSPSHSLALGTSLEDESGSFMLMTPSDGLGANETSGIWFATGPRTSLSAGLNLPALPDGWMYEGWVETSQGRISTGAFRDSDRLDSAQPYSQPDWPLFPGEDFLENAPSGFSFPTDLGGATVVITVEPFPDDTVEQFGFRILSGSVPASASPDTPYSLTSDYQAPGGTAGIF